MDLNIVCKNIKIRLEERDLKKKIVIFTIIITIIFMGFAFKEVKTNKSIPKGVYTVDKGRVELAVEGRGKIACDYNCKSFASKVKGEIISIEKKEGEEVKTGDLVASILVKNDEISRLEESLEEIENKIGEMTNGYYTYIEADVSGKIKDIKEIIGKDITDIVNDRGYIAKIILANGMEYKIISNGGIIDYIYTSEDGNVKAGDVLIRIKHTVNTKEYFELIEEREELIGIISKIFENKMDILADEEGILYQFDVEVGNSIDEDTPIYSLSYGKHYSVDMYITEYDINNIEIGNEAEISMLYNNKKQKGIVNDIQTMQINNDTDDKLNINEMAKYKINILFENDVDTSQFYENMSVDVKIIIDENDNAICVPYECLLAENSGEAYVEIVKGNKRILQNVKIGIMDCDFVEITNGLNVGDKIINYKEKNNSNWLTKMFED